MPTLHDTLHTILQDLSKSRAFACQWQPSHSELLLSQLMKFLSQPPAQPRLPVLDVETTPDLGPLLAQFQGQVPETREDWLLRLEGLTDAELFTLMGQRLTPASIADGSVLPPSWRALKEAAQEPCSRDGLTVAARALAKHSARTADHVFWGAVRGSVADKNKRAEELIDLFLKEQCWWNLFSHPKFNVVYELRVAGGQGARWRVDGPVFVGFLEPFLADA